MIDTANATIGKTLTADELADLPSNGRSPLGFARYAFGAVAKGKHAASQTRPFDNNVADDFSLGGGASASNELLLNGVPNMQDSSRLAGFSSELDAVEAVRVDEFAANAAMGDTSGGTVNITTKPGTNEFHGAVSEYYSGVYTNQINRTAIPGNVFANAGLSVNPVAQAYLKYVPLPNFNRASTKSDGENNYFINDPTTNHYLSHEGRLDYDATSHDRLSFEVHGSKYGNTTRRLRLVSLPFCSNILNTQV